MTDDDLERMAALGPVMLQAIRQGAVEELAGLLSKDLLAMTIAGHLLSPPAAGVQGLTFAERDTLTRAMSRAVLGTDAPTPAELRSLRLDF